LPSWRAMASKWKTPSTGKTVCTNRLGMRELTTVRI
jgi:hypothetical protein